MQNRKLLNIINSLLIAILLLTGGISFILNRSSSPPPTLAADEPLYTLAKGVHTKLGKVNRYYANYINGEFTYMNDEASDQEFQSFTSIDGTYSDNPQFTMLYNADAKVNASAGEDGSAENIFFSFGAPQADIIATTDTELAFLADLHVTIYLNGNAIYTNNLTEDTENIPQTNGPNKYFRQYIDLTNVYLKSTSGEKGAKVEKASGLYEIEVNYLVQRINRTIQGSEWQYYLAGTDNNRATMKYAFYLLDESEYVEYPSFDVNTIDRGNNSDNGTIQYFYNFNKEDYPTYSYDAGRFNIGFSVQTSDKLTSYYDSVFTLNADGSQGTLTFTNRDNSADTFTKTIAKVGDKYPTTLNFTKQGVYTITNKYIVNVSNEYKICNNVVADSDLYPEIDTESELYRSQYKLHIFGFTAHFNTSNPNNELLMLNNGTVGTDQLLVINEDLTRTITSDVSYLFNKSELMGYSPTEKILDKIEDKLTPAQFANFLFASTDQPTISFNYMGEYKYSGITSQSNYYAYSSTTAATYRPEYLRKDDYLELPGYYEVVIRYTYSEYSVDANIGSQVTHVQAFILTISNTSPKISIENRDGTKVNDEGFTNQDVLFKVNPDSDTSLNDNYFNAPISVKLTELSYNKTNPITINYTQGTYITKNARYIATVIYGPDGISSESFEFIIDKTGIQNVKPVAVDSITQLNSDEIMYYQFIQADLNEYYNNSRLFNQPFTLLFDEKASGAKIDVTYKRYYFEKNLTAGTVVEGINSTKYVTTNYELNLSATPQTSTYNYDRSMFNQKLAHVDSVFDLDSSCLILFYLKDQAGNEFRYYVIYDLTIPYVNITPKIENSYNIVSTDATVTWGDYKAIKITGGNFDNTLTNTSTEKFSDYIDVNDEVIKKIYNPGTENGTEYSYLTIPLHQVYITYLTQSNEIVKNYYVHSGDTLHTIDSIPGVKDYKKYDFIDSITLKTAGTQSFADGIFVGENDITYNISDKSNISNSTSSIRNDTSFEDNIWLNLDRSLGLAFVKVADSSTSYGMMVSEKTPINANQLRFSYIEGEADFKVSEVTYDYYELDANSYSTYVEVTYDENEPVPYFPYKVTPTLSNRPFSIDSTIRKSDDTERVFSEIINQETINGQTYTKSGMYVFKRTYAGAQATDKIRYYVYYVDRTGIIEIDAELLNDPRISYEQGYGYVFDFSSDGTKFTALQIQQYFAGALDPSETNLFSSNKLPITFKMPFDKFNTRSLLNIDQTAEAYKQSDYFSLVSAFNENRFTINTTMEIFAILDENTINRINLDARNYRANDLYIADCINPGIYTVIITDKSGYDNGDSKNTNCNKFTFKFEITHSAPEANYHTKDLNLSVSTKEHANNTVSYQEHVSTNSKLLQLTFEKNTDPYRATIDDANFRVLRNGSPIFTLTNNVAKLKTGNSNQLNTIFTLKDGVPIINGSLETKYSQLFTVNDKIENNQIFEVKNVGGVKTAYLNGEMVYEYVEGMYKDANGIVESKFSNVFKDTICTFTIEDDIATYTDEYGVSTRIFTLEDRIPMHNNNIATQYSNIYVFNETLNKYVITIFNENDKDHTYITNYLNEASYVVELSYKGDSTHYKYEYTDYKNEVIKSDFFKKQFAITVDHTAPEYNLNQLLEKDKFHTNKNTIDTTNYFFAVDPSFVFVKQNELETNEIFYRYLGEVGAVTSEYQYSITPDNPIFSTGELPNPRFIETSMSNGDYVYKPMYYGRISESLSRYGYYEIIERDEALNYRVYAIYYNNPNTEISYSYDQAGSNGIQNSIEENLSTSTTPYSIKGAIKDNNGNPIEGVRVSIQGTETYTTTDVSGEFILTEIVGVQTLEFISSNYSFIPATKRVNEANYNYIEGSMDQETLNSRYISVVAYNKMRGTLNNDTPTLVAEGQNLKFALTNISTDYYLRAIVTGSNGLKTEIVNQPDLKNIPVVPLEGVEAWADFVDRINQAITSFSTENSYGFTYNIEFVNRFGENLHLKYVLPGIMLTPDIKETVTNSKFTFTIPSDPSGTTYIRRLEIRKFSGGDSWTIIARDSTNKTISTFNDGKPLEITTYTFTEGEYMFTITDNFNRTSVHYKGVGVNDVRTINYGSHIVLGGMTYTASSVSLAYQTALYKLKVIEINADGTRSDITNALRANYVNEVSNVNNVRTLEFQNNEVQNQTVNGVLLDGIRQFEVSLYVEKLNLTYTYNFTINRTNPSIDLKNLSGEKLKETSNIEGNPTIHTEDFMVTWDASNPLLFTPKVKLTRTYYEDNQEKVEVISNLTNGYRVTKTGLYKAEIYNALGFSDPNRTIYFKRIDGNIIMYSVIKTVNSKESELEVSSDMPNIYIGSETGTAAPLYKYYALKYETTNNEVTTTTYDMVEIRVNPSKGLVYKLITEEDSIYTSDGVLITADQNVYRVYGAEGEDGTVSYGYDQYIQLVYILSTSDFVKATIKTEDHEYVSTATTIGQSLRDNIKNTSDSIDISFPGFNSEKGNPIYLDYYFNGIYVETISNTTGAYNLLTLSNAGVYTLRFYDLAGNEQEYSFANKRNNSFTISLINNVLYTVNGSTPVQNEIFNSTVVIEIINKQLYDSQNVIVSAKRNGKEIALVNSEKSYDSYVFQGQGYYTVTLKADVTGDLSDLERTTITTEYNFTIINDKQAQRSFNIPRNQNFKISKVLRENVNITYALDNTNELWLSSGDEKTGSGIYTVTITAYVPEIKAYKDFTFKVWINDEKPVIISSLEFGEETTKQITLSFNKNLIYQQVGESIIRITGMEDIIINEKTAEVNKRESINLTLNLEYTIQVLTADGKVISSYKLTKNEPLNTISIIIIVIVSIVVIGLVVTFIVLRKHIKYR